MSGASPIHAALVAFCAGDAYGVPWEGRSPQELDLSRLDELPAREDWPRGATSDDTAQLLLACEVLLDGDDGLEERFLARLADELPRIRGAGPSTTAAVRRFAATGALAAQ